MKLFPEYSDESKWSDREISSVEKHFNRLKELHSEGKVVLAGRTLNKGEDKFGIVILEVDSEKEAKNIMINDPAVKSGLMSAELFPYKIALQ